MFQDKKIGFIGGGAMAEAIIGGMLEAGLVKSEQVRVYDVSATRLAVLKEEYGIESCTMKELTAWANVLFLAVKPQVIGSVLTELEENVPADTIVISIGRCHDRTIGGASAEYTDRARDAEYACVCQCGYGGTCNGCICK